ncbi:MAG: 6,7-dimethyl-8-ribityllumazine synthase [Mycobacterium sp.]|nr:6,7-dimethyl-8-ribityllumazine synthase [Mycobacterium sp.]
MSGAGAPEELLPDATGLRVAVVGSRWYGELTDTMVEHARATAIECGAAEPTVVRVSGAFELPVAAQALAADHDAVICLGLVLRGGTPHFDYVCDAVTSGLGRVALDCRIPIGFGVLTCDTEEQARARAGVPGAPEDKGREAALAALESAALLRSLAHHP